MSNEQDNDLSDDYIDLTDTDTSSSSSNNVLFENNQPLVLELHEIVRDPTTEGPENPEPLVEMKKRRRRRKNVLGEQESDISASGSETDSVSLAPSANVAPEQFFDAHESFHAMPENQRSAPIENGLALASSEHASLKIQEMATVKTGSGSTTQNPVSTNRQTSTTQRQVSEQHQRQLSTTISKPVEPPQPPE